MAKKIFKRILKHFRRRNIDNNFADIEAIDYTKADEIIRNCVGTGAPKEIKKIAFLVLSFPSLKRFENIFKHLPNHLFDIVYNCNDADQIKAFAAYNRYTCRSLCSVLSKNETYSIAVSNLMWFAWHIYKFLPNVIAKTHIRIIYSGGFSVEVLSRNHNYIYDKILCYGPYQKKILESRTDAEIVSVGNPALDYYFWETFDSSSIKNRILKDKKTIAWLLTLSDASSLKEFLPIMEILNTRYNVFVNPHPLTSKEDLDLLGNSKLKNQIVSDSNLALLKEADFIICDYGGASFRALYLDKNIMLFNPTNAEKCSFLDNDSPEFFLRTKIKSFDSTQAREIAETLENENYWKEQKEIRKQLSAEFFVDERGTSSYKIAKILKHDLKNNTETAVE
ncbi:MAG: hypothetical protein J5787_06275 [Alphaproteobacteria bacterium]|nr:hypothetical protein [Alphaproteobacteria bacterium]